MPRKSRASLAVVTAIPSRPSPPKRFSVEMKAAWRAVVGSKPATWFDAASTPLLECYIHAICTFRALSTQPTIDGKALRMLDRQSRLVGMLGTRLRLTQQAKYNARSAAHATIPPIKPWEPR